MPVQTRALSSKLRLFADKSESYTKLVLANRADCQRKPQQRCSESAGVNGGAKLRKKRRIEVPVTAA